MEIEDLEQEFPREELFGGGFIFVMLDTRSLRGGGYSVDHISIRLHSV